MTLSASMPLADEIARAETDLFAPVGQAGSGRVRYGAAMTLWRAGRLSVEALEVYRICAPVDGEDPIRLLRTRGLPVPVRSAPDAIRALSALAVAIDDYLATLSGTGIAEVRQGLALARQHPPVCGPKAGNAVADTCLAPALAALTATHPGLAGAIGDAAPHLAWVTYDAYPRAEIGEAFATGHAFASIAGEGSPFAAEDFDLGLFVIAPDVLYRDHSHRAPELYAPLTGPHGWRFAPGAPMVLKPAHEPVWNEPFAPHATKVGPLPFLGLYGWTRDVKDPARVVPAEDWPALEAMRITDEG